MRFEVWNMQRLEMSRAGAMGVLLAFAVAACGCQPYAPPTPPMPTGSVTDVEGNVYPTIVIGKQEWMVTNLATATYDDGTPIPNVTDAAAWGNLATDAYAWLDNDVANKAPYGAYYNWNAVDTGKLCPTGWSVPSEDDWGALVDFLGGELVAGGLMKEPGTVHWQAPNKGATNLSGFTALPAGERDLTGAFTVQGQYAEWWTSDDVLISLPPDANFWHLGYEGADTAGGESEWPTGMSVRCFRAAP